MYMHYLPLNTGLTHTALTVLLYHHRSPNLNRRTHTIFQHLGSITFPLLREEQNSDSLDDPEELAMSELFSPEVSGIHMKLETTGGEEQLALYARFHRIYARLCLQ